MHFLYTVYTVLYNDLKRAQIVIIYRENYLKYLINQSCAPHNEFSALVCYNDWFCGSNSLTEFWTLYGNDPLIE